MTHSRDVASTAVSSTECALAVRQLWDFLDGRMSVSARQVVEVHLATCERCPPHFAFAQQMRAALAASLHPELDGSDESQLRQKVRTALSRLGEA